MFYICILRAKQGKLYAKRLTLFYSAFLWIPAMMLCYKNELAEVCVCFYIFGSIHKKWPVSNVKLSEIFIGGHQCRI